MNDTMNIPVPEELLRRLTSASEHPEYAGGDPACVAEAKQLVAWHGHKLVLKVENGGVSSELICPKVGCQPVASCGDCGRERGDEATDRCPQCPADADDAAWPECWLATWADNEDLTDFLCDDASIEVTVGIDPEFDGDAPVIDFVEGGT